MRHAYVVCWPAKHGNSNVVRNFKTKRDAVRLAASKAEADLHTTWAGGTVAVDCYEHGKVVYSNHDMG